MKICSTWRFFEESLISSVITTESEMLGEKRSFKYRVKSKNMLQFPIDRNNILYSLISSEWSSQRKHWLLRKIRTRTNLFLNLAWYGGIKCHIWKFLEEDIMKRHLRNYKYDSSIWSTKAVLLTLLQHTVRVNGRSSYWFWNVQIVSKRRFASCQTISMRSASYICKMGRRSRKLQ